MTVTIEEEERGQLLLALAVLTMRSPGFDYCNGLIAGKLQGLKMYEEFKKVNSHLQKVWGSMPKDLEFRQGYYCAVANLMRLHGEAPLAEDVLYNFGGRANFDGIDPGDVEVLKPIAVQVDRKFAIQPKGKP